ncbi:QueT transporter family protein [Gemmiger sp.]|uniref:QueT transporter family protein n=1 Tax=Gemmiger sp. TaxID=2049027 RepID=UPI002A74946E|nr:QueT transporter family protein [Gemmiger sp.]MDY2695322.1 QueT transporter family protein [Gemmiger sp.]
MKTNQLSVARLVRCAVIAAVYVVLCLALAPFSYGAVQVRIAEALCLLPVFGAEYIVGVTLGCFLANLLGSTVIDVVFGTLATLLACLVTYKLRNVRVKGLAIPASLPPVVFNMLIVGAFEITFFFSDTAPTAALAAFNAVAVGIGEIISCTIVGVALVKLVESNEGLKRIFTEK